MSDDPGGFPYTVDILDKNLHVVGDGPLANVTYVEQTECLDQAGEIKIGVPASDPRMTLLTNERIIRIRTREGNWLPGVIRSRSLKPGGMALYDIGGPDLITELSNRTTGMARNYNGASFWFVLTDLLYAMAPGALPLDPLIWNLIIYDRSSEVIVHRFDGETILAAFAFVTGRMDLHFRLARHAGWPARYLEVGSFGTDCGLRLINVHHHLVAQEDNADILLLKDLDLVEESGRIVNWLIPLGAGDGQGQLTLRNVDANHGGGTAGTYPVYVKAGPNRGDTTGAGTAGSTVLTVTSTTNFAPDDPIYVGPLHNLVTASCETNEVLSVGTGVLNLKAPLQHNHPRDAVVAWPQYYLYDPVSYAALGAYELVNAWKDISPIDDTDAAITAAANTLYDCACAFLRKNATSQVVYQATAMWIPWTVRAGDKIRLVYTGAVMRDGVAYSFLDVDALYTILKITRRVNADGSTQATLEIASVDKRIMDDIGAITHMLESIGDYETRTQTYPSTIQDTNAGTLYGNPACYHYTPVRLAMASKYQACLYLDRATLTFKTDVMSYTASNFVVTQDTVYPSGITLSLLNEAGVATDVTTVLGGPWGDPAASVEATLDVTQLLRNAIGGLKQSHRFRWACGSASRGKIEVTLRMAMTVQSYVRG